MKLIPLPKGLYAKVDDDDFERLNKFKWYTLRQGKSSLNLYARRTARINRRNVTILMHREILQGNHSRTDHIDGDGLNNQKDNLRIATPVQNGMNMKLKKHSVPYKGVSQVKSSKRFKSVIKINKQYSFLGTFSTAIDAAIAYDAAAYLHYGDYARTNQKMGLL